MSLELQHDLNGRLLIIRATGKLTGEDYKDKLRPVMDVEIARHGKVRFLVEMRDFSAAPFAAWEDFKFGVKHFNHVERIAVVGDRNWEKWMTILFKPFTMATMKYFNMDQLAEARLWIGATPIPPQVEPARMNAPM